jgi:hypothetical protein
MASAALMAASVMSTGGIAALAVKIVRGKKIEANENPKIETERRSDHGSDERNNDEQSQ